MQQLNLWSTYVRVGVCLRIYMSVRGCVLHCAKRNTLSVSLCLAEGIK